MYLCKFVYICICVGERLHEYFFIVFVCVFVCVIACDFLYMSL